MSNTTQFLSELTHEERNVRLRAAMVLATTHEPEVTDALVTRLTVEKDFHVLEDVTWAVVQHGARAVPAVLRLLGAEEAVVRRQAAHVLSKLPDKAHAPHLHGVIADADPDVAIKAYRAAANTGAPEVVPSLAARLGDGDQLQRDQLSVAFAKLGTVGVPELVAALASADAGVRLHAAEALAQVGDVADDAAAALRSAATDPDPEVRLAAVMALGALSPEVGDAELRELASSDDAQVSAVAKNLLAGRG